jgi:CheY-like chemotaxis protein
MANYPRIVFSERLSTGIMVHFETGAPVFFPTQFLYEQRTAQPDIVFTETEEEGDNSRNSEAVADAPNRRVAESSHTPSSTEATSSQAKPQTTKQPKILVVDDNERVRSSIGKVLEANQFRVATAANVSEALNSIGTEPFDVLLSNMRMTEADEGFSLVNAMHNKNPDVVTLVYTGVHKGSAELEHAKDALLLQANEVSVKPLALPMLVSLIHEKLEKLAKATNVERVAAILERDSSATIRDWLLRVEREDELTSVPLTREQRTGHLPKLLEELVHRLRVPRKLGTKVASEAAAAHGKIRRSQGYSIPMIVEESRILQVSIFETLQNNLSTVDFSLLMLDVVAIADEVDSQLKQAIISYNGQVASA